MLGCIPVGLGESKADKKAEYKFVIVPKVVDPGSTACRPGSLLSRLLRKPEPIRRRRRRARIREAEDTSPHSACPSRCPLPRFSRPKNGAMKSDVDVAGSNVPAALCQRSGGNSANPCRTTVPCDDSRGADQGNPNNKVEVARPAAVIAAPSLRSLAQSIKVARMSRI